MSRVFWTAFFVALAVEVFSLLPLRPATAPPMPAVPYVSGILHVHSQFSENGTALKDVVAAAKDAHADFVVVTDHRSSQARSAQLEKEYEGLDVFVEMEATTPAGESLLFYSHTAERGRDDDAANRLAWEHYLGRENPPGVFGITAHPSDVRQPWNRLDRFAEGTELVNFRSMALREWFDTPLGFLTTAAIAPFNNFLAAVRFFQIYPKDLLAWDAMNAISPGHFAVLGHDNTTRLALAPGLNAPWPSELTTFRLGSNIVFLREPRAATFEGRKKQYYLALTEGRSAMLFQGISPWPGNDFRVRCGDTTYRSGDRVPFSSACVGEIDTPPSLRFPKRVRLWKDGEKAQESDASGAHVTFPITAPGIYRAEVWIAPTTLFHGLQRGEAPYVLYNPITVR